MEKGVKWSNLDIGNLRNYYSYGEFVMKSIKLSDYFKMVKPKYIIFKLIPDTSIRNYNSASIARAINHLGKTLRQRISKDAKVWNIEAPAKCSFMIDIRKDRVNFYFLVPEPYESLFREKLNEVWPKVTVSIVDKIENFSEDALKYQIYYKSEDALSLSLDKRCNEPLNSLLGILDIIQDDDRIGIFYNFKPTSQKRWSKQWSNTMKRAEGKEPLDKEVIGSKYIIKTLLLTIAEILDGILEGISELVKKEKKNINFVEVAVSSLIGENRLNFSPATMKKKDSVILTTQIAVLSESKDKNRRVNNANAVAQSFYQLNEDNELTHSLLSVKNISYTNYNIGAIENKMSIDECQNLLELPGRSILEKHNVIERIDVLETPVPKELQTGVMCIGETIYKGMRRKTYLSSDREFKSLTLCLIGPTRAGKSTLIQNLTKNAVENGECAFLFDFCGNCELSDEVATVFNKSEVLIIDCSDIDRIQGLGYNEAWRNSDNLFVQYENAKSQTSQVLTLVNSINAEDKDLSGRMDRYLEAASLIVFINGGSLKDVFDVLKDFKVRDKFINRIPETHKNNLEEYVASLRELDDVKEIKDKDTKKSTFEVIGTKMSLINGILDRVNKLKRNTYMEIMLKHDCNNNINLLEEIQKSQLICLKMPEIMFKTETEKDIFCTYWLTKVWLALQIRKSLYKNKAEFESQAVKVNIFVDELYQVPQTQEFLRSKISQIAKFKAKPIISCHHLKQIPGIRQELKAANTSYMLIAGCNKDNYMELKDELEPYTLEDLLNLKRYHSLNLIKYENGWAKFISKLPQPII